jgi:hypothetical protein
MAENPEKTSAAADTEKARKTAETVVERAAGLTDEVMTSVEAGQRAALDAVRKFFDSVEEAIRGEGASQRERENIIDSALNMAERIVGMQSDFVRSVARSAEQSLRKSGDASR